MNKSKTLLALVLLLTVAGRAQNVSEKNALSRSLSDISGRAILGATIDDGFAPLWMTANQYENTNIKGCSGNLQAGIFHDSRMDSLHKWRIGYGLDLSVTAGNGFSVLIQQAYVDFDYRRVRISIGSKERPMAMKNQELSTGSQTLGINARPMPDVRFEIPDYLPVTRWAAIKGHIGYGLMMDGRWQEEYVAPGLHYVKGALLHTKAGYLRLGNEARFPVTFEAGLEMACEFGGTAYSPAFEGGSLKMSQGAKDFVKAIYGGGSDATDGDYANAQGNTLGSWLFGLKYKGRGWDVRAYYDHYFEDHSQMFGEYGWLDGLLGFEVTLPRNNFVTSVVYEHMRTDYQSGPIYHDHTDAIPTQISAADNYYNHNLYQGWQYYGLSLGNALFVSPLYKDNGNLEFNGNRFRAHHFGLSGDPSPALHYRLLYTHITSWGTYNVPFDSERHTNSFMAEACWSPSKVGKLSTKGWSLTAAVALDRGSLIGNNTGVQFYLSKAF